ncbi:hypothetical protein ACQKPE_17215 [Pseudomonas sp. NPDC089554]|uniref:hypothetical protein n=1 Tax=Pseudomonas sp. NPDC089554 TaxID=3390653 RepID=UPI003D05914B
MSVSDTLGEGWEWIKDGADHVWIGLDDAASGWGEFFTGSRKAKVEAAQRRFGYMVEDIQALGALVNLMADSHRQVIQALAEQASTFGEVFGFDPRDPQIDVLRVTSVASGVLGTASGLTATGALAFAGAARVWAMMAPARIGVQAASSELLVAGNVIRVGTTAAETASVVASGGGLITGVAARAVSVAMAAGKAAVVTAVITTVLQTVLQGLEVAALRRQALRIEEEVDKLKGLLHSMAGDIEALVNELKVTYDGLAALEGGCHVVIDSASGRRLELETFYDRVKRLLPLIEEQGSENRDPFQSLRDKLETDHKAIRDTLLGAINKNIVALGTAKDTLARAAAALRGGVPLEQAKAIFPLPAPLLEKLAAFIAEHPGEPRLVLSGAGQFDIVPA